MDKLQAHTLGHLYYYFDHNSKTIRHFGMETLIINLIKRQPILKASSEIINSLGDCRVKFKNFI